MIAKDNCIWSVVRLSTTSSLNGAIEQSCNNGDIRRRDETEQLKAATQTCKENETRLKYAIGFRFRFSFIEIVFAGATPQDKRANSLILTLLNFEITFDITVSRIIISAYVYSAL